MLTIALVPSIVLLLAAFGAGGYLIYDAVNGRDFATKIRNSEGPSFPFFNAVQEERRLSLRELGGNKTEHAALVAQRDKTDQAAAAVSANLQNFIGDAPTSVQRNIAVLSGLLQQAPQIRQQVDAAQITQLQAFSFYNKIIDQFVDGLTGLAQQAPNAQNAFDRITAVPLFTATDQMQRADALAAAAESGGGFTDENYRAFVTQVGAYHTQLDASVGKLIPEVRANYDKLIASDAWKTVTAVENALLTDSKAKLPVSDEQWRAAATQAKGGLSKVFVQQSANATSTAIDEADNTLLTSAIAAAIALLVAVAVFFFALRLSNRLIGRLARLREDTLDVAEVQLPELVARVRAGEQVDVEEGAYLLDHGDDEIGEVAKAFNKAQQTAVSAAVEEAKTREGTKAVFLNIAHRSQVIVHRQLKVLDQAERKQEDPDQLDTLFQLDHLSTRARRNAENLIILGGGQPGRQWRNPVSLTELVRGASAETEDFARVKTAKLPSIAVQGPVVGDLVHLLAELIDNATSFSPPQSRVEIRGNVVGKGVVIEVEDQGLGIEPEQGDQLNQMLAAPPDFGIMALSTEPRLGLFVVARLAARHGISVHLRESAYGGTRAIVLVRSELLSSADEPGDLPSGQYPVPAESSSGQYPVPAPGYPVAEPPPLPEEDSGEGTLPPVRPLRRARHRTEPPMPVPVAAAPSLTTEPLPPMPPRPPRAPRPESMRPHPAASQQPPAWPPQDTRQPQGGRPQQPSRPEAPGRPALPQRRRQQNLVPQLREDRPAVAAEQVREDSPELVRNRLAAFQQGTRRGREQEPEQYDQQYQDLDVDNGYGERE